jgi:hypothetical protein
MVRSSPIKEREGVKIKGPEAQNKNKNKKPDLLLSLFPCLGDGPSLGSGWDCGPITALKFHLFASLLAFEFDY